MIAPRRLRIAGLALIAVAVFAIAFVASPLVPSRNAVFALTALLLALGSALYLGRDIEPAWFLTAGIVLSPMAGNWEYIGIPGMLSPDRWLLVAGIVAVLVRTPGVRSGPRLEYRSTSWVLLVAILYVVGSALAAGTLMERRPLIAIFDQFGVIPFLLFVVAPVAFHTAHQRAILLGGLVGMGAYLGLTAIFEVIGPQSLVYPRFIVDPEFGYQMLGRARGPSGDAVTNGVALFAAGVAAAISLRTWSKRQLRVVAGIVLLLVTVGLLLTLQRSVWLASIAGVAVALLSFAETRRFAAPALAGATVIVLAILALVPAVSRSADERSTNRATVYDRVNLSRAAVNVLAAQPLLGLGWQRFRTDGAEFFEQGPDIPLSAGRTIIHNVFLSFGADLGLIGLTLWLAALLTTLREAILVRGPPALAVWRIGLVAFATFFVIVANFVFPEAFSFRMLWLLAGVVVAGHYIARSSDHPDVDAAAEAGHPRLARA